MLDSNLMTFTLGAESPTAFYWLQLVLAIAVFVASIFILGKFAWPKILGALDEREQKILGEINAAEEARERADKALKEYESSLAEARAEANKMIEQTKADQSRLAAELRNQAEQQAAELMTEARRNIKAMKEAAVAEVYHEAAKAATQMAEKILERELNATDQQRLVDDAVSTFSGSGA
jgi:F-type H+-transporting ATPase subunit b